MTSSEDGSWRIGVDIGGTFTDLVIVDQDGGVHAVKVPTDPMDPARGVLAALERSSASFGLGLGEILGRCSHFVHGTTIATNTVLEGKGAKVGLLATRGFRDSLEIRRGLRADMWDHRSPWPAVMVPRKLRRPVSERIDRDGRSIVPLDLGAVAEALEVFQRENVESIAICFLNSFLNDAHERECESWIRSAWPGVWVCRSSQIAPVIGEYERSSTTTVNAYIAPKVVPYLRDLDDRLRTMGLPGRLLLIQSNGGAVSVDQIDARPVALLLSGPAAGVGALRFFSDACGSSDLISMEIGGTSCDVTLVRGGHVAETDRISVGGYDAVMPATEIHTVGTGGGTIAGIDAGGMLYVGPQGAGARPGPACYGLGGDAPTVTDAQVVLGRLRSGRYAGGLIELDSDLAVRAVRDEVADPLGLDVTDAAAGIIRMAEQSVLHALERMSSERGCDPKDFVLVAGGGAGALHGASVARELGCNAVFVPKLAGVFCAFGMCNTDIRHDYVQSRLQELNGGSGRELAAAFASLEAEAQSLLNNEGFDGAHTAFERLLDLKYAGQQWPVKVSVSDIWQDSGAVHERFEREFLRLYGYTQPDGQIQINNLRVVATGHLPKIGLQTFAGCDDEPAPVEHRDVYVDQVRGREELAVYDGNALRSGHRVAGPALVEEQTTTVLVGHQDVLEVDPYGNYMIRLNQTGATDNVQ